MTDSAIDGVVRSWSNEEGWGVLDSPETPGGCWVHYSNINQEGYRALEPGERIRFTFENVRDQDGYVFRAVEVWRASGR
jgi:CspA family cold shock protein